MQVISFATMRSDCPVNYALEIFGDKWTFLIVRDLIDGKRFYKDFLGAKEGIATNILSDRLKRLESNGVVTSRVFQELKTKKEYQLTPKGKDLIPLLLDIIVWSDKYGEKLDVSETLVKRAVNDRENLIRDIVQNLK